jgi:hypothetical protein
MMSWFGEGNAWSARQVPNAYMAEEQRLRLQVLLVALERFEQDLHMLASRIGPVCDSASISCASAREHTQFPTSPMNNTVRILAGID